MDSSQQEIRDRLTTLEVKHEERHTQVVDVLKGVQTSLESLARNQAAVASFTEKLEKTEANVEAIESNIDRMELTKGLHSEKLKGIEERLEKVDRVEREQIRQRTILGVIVAVFTTAWAVIAKDIFGG